MIRWKTLIKNGCKHSVTLGLVIEVLLYRSNNGFWLWSVYIFSAWIMHSICTEIPTPGTKMAYDIVRCKENPWAFFQFIVGAK